jgi:HlyD family secretion protein
VLQELQLKAPSGGMVSNRLREPGEMLAAGGGVVELVDLNHLYLKVYVPENQIGKIRLGLPAQISTDAFPRIRLPPPSAILPPVPNSPPRKCKPRMSG